MKNKIDDETLKLISDLSDKLGVATSEIINQYSVWYFTQALFLIVFGIICMLFALKAKDPLWGDVDFKVFRVIIFAIGFFFISFNVPDIFAPDAIAIHRLISDLKG